MCVWQSYEMENHCLVLHDALLSVSAAICCRQANTLLRDSSFVLKQQDTNLRTSRNNDPNGRA